MNTFRNLARNRRYDTAKPDGVFIFIGTYPDEASARYDYDLVKDLHAAGQSGPTTPR